MVWTRISSAWNLPEHQITGESAYFNRRHFLRLLTGVSIVPLVGCQSSPTPKAEEGDFPGAKQLKDLTASRNARFAQVDRPITTRKLASTYNNFYEYGTTKSIAQAAQKLQTDGWKVEVTGLVKNPRTYGLEDLYKQFPLEERVYRFRCVEAWSMCLPWIGFPMRSLMAAVEPLSQAKYVQFTSYYDDKIMLGQGFPLFSRPWPYTEMLTLPEMANELAFFAVGIYGQTLPKQHGAPLRAVLPWKYGFKGAKSIVKIEFTDQAPSSFWNKLVPEEYDLEANVNPNKPHPRWSQAKERFVGDTQEFTWKERPTLPYNGYGEFVASLYST